MSGPRQAGKTTLLQALFPDYRYVSLEEPDARDFAENDPKGFLRQFDRRVIFDEAQRVPRLFSYLQVKVDADKEMGQYILSGSQNFLLLETITQSLAGRVALFKLLPLSLSELSDQATSELPQAVFKGGYPALYDRDLSPASYFPSYLETYLERDVRAIQTVKDLTLFRTFMRLCAGRAGQTLQIQSLANDCGISVPTVKNWLSILEASYILFQLPPFFENFNKRLVKSPKLYFYDTGLVCNLLGIREAEQVAVHPLRGGLFENMAISELLKNRWNRGERADFYFWKDSNGVEVDLVEEAGIDLNLFEMKYSYTPNTDYFKGIASFRKVSQRTSGTNAVIYAGEEKRQYSQGQLLGWKKLAVL
ncbi:MAG: ATP-binding protein [Saprospiraceae bacterium]|nr:ATP-binding protein [Saprospiraceae bacterium]